MTEILLSVFFISVLLLFLSTGVWVALSMIGVSTIAMTLFTSRPVGDAMATTIWGTSSSWTLTALPLFVWMGEILFRTKLSENLFEGLSPWMQKLPGGLIHVNVVGCALFAAISGSSAATVATVGKMSIPELRKRNYPEKILLGVLQIWNIRVINSTFNNFDYLRRNSSGVYCKIIRSWNYTWDNDCINFYGLRNFMVFV